MNITFLIGNGFDINLGLKTTYQAFYKYYVKRKSENPLIDELKKNIKGDYKTWADLELALGNYTQYLKDREEFETIFEDIQESLAEYISIEEEKYSYDIADKKNTLYENLVYPERWLPLADSNQIRDFKNLWGTETWNINIITFNYSKILEKIFDFKFKNIVLMRRSGSESILRDIKHIHGYTDGNMILGVNDVSQISNIQFKDESDILDALIKPECNKALRHLIDKECEDIISSSQLICTYGLSIGDTDKVWWEKIGNHLLNIKNSLLLIFAWDENRISANQRYKLNQRIRPFKNGFLSKTGLSETDIEKIANKIIVGHNTDLFNIPLTLKE